MLKDGFDYFGRGFVLEDGAVGGASEEPESGDDASAIAGEAVGRRNEGEAIDVAVDAATLGFAEEHADGGRFGDDSGWGDVEVLRSEFEIDLE